MEQVPDTFAGLFWGYTAIWAVISAYIFYLVLKAKNIEKRLDEKEKSQD